MADLDAPMQGPPPPQAVCERPVQFSPADTGSGRARILGQRIGAVHSTELAPLSADSGPIIGLDTFRSDPRFAGVDGTGYTAVVIDSGIDRDHPFFGPDEDGDGVADRIIYGRDFSDNDMNADDRNGHGTNVASIIGSSDPYYTGVAPGVNIIALKVLGDYGDGDFWDIGDALEWTVDHVDEYNIVSVNLSLGDGQLYTAERTGYQVGDDLEALADAGVTVVAAAGNAFYEQGSQEGVVYPAADPNTLAIGAVYDADIGEMSYRTGATAFTTAPDRITPFSQRHESITRLFAPGAAIGGAGAGGGVSTYHGTSQAAPQVAGAAVLAQQMSDHYLGRRLALPEMEALLVGSGTTIGDGDDEDDNVTNTGLEFTRLDVMAMAEAIVEMAGEGDDADLEVTAGGDRLVDGSTLLSSGNDYGELLIDET
ncbi:MAG: S8 family serine peptidase, partial [Planctomycetota bacterium]